ncbi:MAG TPA: nuclear transport factor 2 family protein [Vicinamibacterales bacterium]|nr:nuclear transport factor 2 family protein [Vicinamibacterales bacterium]
MTNRHLLALLAGAALIAHAALAQTPAADEILKVEQQRIDLLTSGKLDQLGEMLSPTLSYTHSSGVLDSKDKFLETLRSGQVAYRSLAHRNVQARFATPDVAILNGESDVVVSIGGKEQSIPLRFTIVYVKRERGWVLEAWQSTRRP